VARVTGFATAFVTGDNHLTVTYNVTGDIKPTIHKIISQAQRVFHRPTHKIVQKVAADFVCELEYLSHIGVCRTFSCAPADEDMVHG
jgi:hypothetical protein